MESTRRTRPRCAGIAAPDISRCAAPGGVARNRSRIVLTATAVQLEREIANGGIQQARLRDLVDRGRALAPEVAQTGALDLHRQQADGQPVDRCRFLSVAGEQDFQTPWYASRMGLKRLAAEPAAGRSTQVWVSAGSRLPGWKVFGRFRLAGLDWGLRVDPEVGHDWPTQADQVQP